MLTNIRSILLALGLVFSTSDAHASMKELQARVPADANALVAIDVEKLLNSPLGKTEGWKDKLANAYSERPFIIPPSAKRVVMAALITPGGGSAWEVSVMDLADAPSIESIAQAEQGYVDNLSGKAAAWSPINAYFVQLEPKVLAVVAPASRQFAARWVRHKPSSSSALGSAYLQQAAKAIDQGAELVMAIDLEDMTSTARVEHRFQDETFESLASASVDLPALAKLLASMKGLTLKIEVGEDITGAGVIEFGEDASLLKDLAKPLLLEVLAKEGMRLPDLESWDATVKGKTLAVRGKLSTEGLRNLLSVIDPPAPPQAIATSGDDSLPQGSGSAGSAAKAKASQQYYQAIAKMLDHLESDKGSGSKSASLAESASWLKRDSRRIDRLPTLDVDPDLVAWGAEASGGLRAIGGLFEEASLQTRARTSGILDSGGYGGSGAAYRAQAARDSANTGAQRRQAANEVKTAAYNSANEIIEKVRASRARIRAEMTKRYGLEF